MRQLTKAGCKKVFHEVASGAKASRAQLRRVMAVLEAGNVLMVTRLDRLVRSTRDLLTPRRHHPPQGSIPVPAIHGATPLRTGG